MVPERLAIPFEWALAVRDQCQHQEAQFFHKQNGGRNKKPTGRLLDGQEYNEMPEIPILPVPAARKRRQMANELVPESARRNLL